MKSILCVLNPYMFNQELVILEGSQKIEIIKVPTSNLGSEICMLANETNITEVALAAPIVYAEGIKEDIELYSVTTYGQNKINVTIV